MKQPMRLRLRRSVATCSTLAVVSMAFTGIVTGIITGIITAAEVTVAEVTAAKVTAAEKPFEDDFSDGMAHWQAYGDSQKWTIEDRMLRRIGTGRDTALLAKVAPAESAMIEAEVRISPKGGRQTFGLFLRGQADGSRIMLRYYDTRGGADALELLEYRGKKASETGVRSKRLQFKTDRWYRMKAAIIDSTLYGKLWLADQKEPDWQLRAAVNLKLGKGAVGLGVHDSTIADFRRVRILSGRAVAVVLKKERQEQLRGLRERVSLLVVPSEFTQAGNSGPVRRLDVLPLEENRRMTHAGSILDGKLTVSIGDHEIVRHVTGEEMIYGEYRIDVPEPSVATDITVRLDTKTGLNLETTLQLRPAQQRSWRGYVTTCLDTLIAHGTDTYGKVKSPLLMSVLDTKTLRSPERPLKFASLVRLEDRIHRRAERGSNFWYDQSVLRAMYQVSRTGKDPKYAAAADAYIKYALKHCYKANDKPNAYRNGMQCWGTHVFWDCYRDRPGGDGDGDGPHEILVFLAEWQELYRINPAAVRRNTDGIWLWHIVDKATGYHNRHDDRRPGCDFAFSGGSIAHALSAMYSQTKEKKYLEQAKTVALWHWNNRNKITGLVADSPGIKTRFDGHHCFTTITGPHASQLLRCFELTGDRFFYDAAASYIKAYDKYGYDAKAKNYHAALTLEGVPIPARSQGGGYAAYFPTGYVNIWRTSIYSYEFSLSAAQSSLYAYELSGKDAGSRDKQLLDIARQWAEVINKSLPAKTGRRWKRDFERAMPESIKTAGVYAEDYGRAISFFVHLYRATGEKQHLRSAEKLAGEAVSKLFVNGLFRGHPAKPYYETTNGVGLLLVALLELDKPDQPQRGAF